MTVSVSYGRIHFESPGYEYLAARYELLEAVQLAVENGVVSREDVAKAMDSTNEATGTWRYVGWVRVDDDRGDYTEVTIPSSDAAPPPSSES